ncbi:hypothetical protein [Stakelama tenebrarum]|uniref:Uncharacterized protein n=1 Tax=Stakelama tenebrarum TaxID=2711215 RepID=A0A6G6Y2Z4_9SPHN|nr:hypothetical protein [Sphingosinithalassobacter tenebrarum]QIG79295.1 hypothetical protein G5C33_05480 [Sphingosinithalassobacter tenebrarum]
MRDFIEVCGRHPFATGLFALIGIFGLLFSFFDFAVSQSQNAENTAQTEQLASSVGRVQDSVDDIGRDAEDRSGFVPILARPAPIVDDNLSFPARYQGRKISWIRDHVPEAFPNVWMELISIESSADRVYVQTAPYLIIDVVDVRPISDDLAGYYGGERGAAAEIRYFVGSVTAQKGWHYAPLVDSMNGEYRDDIDFFSLAPHEPEEFILGVDFAAGYLFSYRIGVHYKFEGEHGVHWVTDIRRSGLPTRPMPLTQYADNDYTPGTHPDLEFQNSANIAQRSERNEAQARRGILFNPRQIEGRAEPDTL